MLIPEGHYREVARRSRRRFSSREKWFIWGSVASVTVLVVAVAIAFTSVQRTSKNGCIDVSAATVIGGSELYRCGDRARELCTAPIGSRTDNVSFRNALVDACRKAGLPVPPAAATS